MRIDLADPAADLEPLVAALLGGRSVAIPTDTVYGLACAAHLPDACERTLRLKGRDLGQPTAIVCASLDTVFSTALPELLGRAGVLARRLLPGSVTVIVPNPNRRFRWLCGADPAAIGVRVPVLDAKLARAIDRVGAVMATSANLHGAPDPASLEDVPAALLERCEVVVDGGRLRGSALDRGRPTPDAARRAARGRRPAAAVLAALAE